MNVDYGTLHSIATVAAIIAFAAVCWWAFRPANRQRFEEDGRLPLITDPLQTRKTHGAEAASRTPAGEHDK